MESLRGCQDGISIKRKNCHVCRHRTAPLGQPGGFDCTGASGPIDWLCRVIMQCFHNKACIRVRLASRSVCSTLWTQHCAATSSIFFPFSRFRKVVAAGLKLCFLVINFEANTKRNCLRAKDCLCVVEGKWRPQKREEVIYERTYYCSIDRWVVNTVLDFKTIL